MLDNGIRPLKLAPNMMNILEDIAKAGEYEKSAEELYALVESGVLSLCMSGTQAEHCFMLLGKEEFTNFNSLTIVGAAGDMKLKENHPWMWPELQKAGKANDCDVVRIKGRRGFGKVLASTGWSEKFSIFEKQK
jgi:hypothetical protein